MHKIEPKMRGYILNLYIIEIQILVADKCVDKKK
jgi:hypothetical protein